MESINSKIENTTRVETQKVVRVVLSALNDLVSSSFGPRASSKVFVDAARKVRITKDGKAILQESNVTHPVAQLVVRSCTSLDEVAADGKITFVQLVAESVLRCEEHPRMALSSLTELISALKLQERLPLNDELFSKVAECYLATKLTSRCSRVLSPAVLEAYKVLDDFRDVNLVEHVSVRGTLSVRVVRGLVLEHGARSFEMPSELNGAYVLAMNVCLENEKTEATSEFLYSSVDSLTKMHDDELRAVGKRIDRILELRKELNAPLVVVNQHGIDPVSLARLARGGVYAVRRAKRRNLERLQRSCGCTPIASIDELSQTVLGKAENVREIERNGEKLCFIEGVSDPHSVTLFYSAPCDDLREQIVESSKGLLRLLREVERDGCVLRGGRQLWEGVASKCENDLSRAVARSIAKRLPEGESYDCESSTRRVVEGAVHLAHSLISIDDVLKIGQ